MGTAAALSLTGILRIATVRLGGGAGSLSRAGIVLALAFTLAGIDTPADMRVAEDIGGVLLGFVVGTDRESRTEDKAADSGSGQASEIASRHRCRLGRGI